MENQNGQSVQNNTVTEAVENNSTQQSSETVVTPEIKTPVVPEKYDLKLNDGSFIEPSYLDQFSQFAKEKGFTQEQAQEFLTREANAVSQFVDKQLQEFKQTQEAWIHEIKTDKEFGGEKYTQSVELAHRALKQFGSPKFIEELDTNGYGNHPELIRIFAKIGNMLKDDSMVSPNSNSGSTKTFEEIFYGKKNN